MHVCILTAGRGLRLGSATQRMNKALLPVGEKAALSRIVESFPVHYQYVIALGYRGDQVRDYLLLAHSERSFHFVWVEPFEGAGSGPGLSVLQCESELQQPFFLVCSDTLWEESVALDKAGNWLGVSEISSELSSSYCNVEIEHDKITSLKDKVALEGSRNFAFIGLAKIEDTQVFFEGLKQDESLNENEKQLASGFNALIMKSVLHAYKIQSWKDVGTAESYQLTQSASAYDFGKPGETIYRVNNTFIKHFSDSSIALNLVERSKLNPVVFPPQIERHGSFLAYPYQGGDTFYVLGTPQRFERLLHWLDTNLWLPKVPPIPEIRIRSQRFYREKTFQRLESLQKNYADLENVEQANQRELKPLREILAAVPWRSLFDIKPVFFHGDLQFDNVLCDPQGERFTLIDWRPNFAGALDFGDWYYDLAKLNAGIHISFRAVRDGKFSFSSASTEVTYEVPAQVQRDEYLEVLRNFIDEKGLDAEKVEILTGLVFLNMAPLHRHPFDLLLYYHAKLWLTDCQAYEK